MMRDKIDSAMVDYVNKYQINQYTKLHDTIHKIFLYYVISGNAKNPL